MHVIEILFSFLLLNTVKCLAGIIIEPSDPDHSVIFAKTTAQVLNLCYKKDFNTVGIAGNSDGLLIRTLYAHQFSLVTLLGNTSKRISKDGLGKGLPHKLQVFVVTSSSATELEKILKGIKDSTWWNHLASFLILDSSSGSEDGCSNAFDMLWTAWEMDLLNTKFVCINRTKDQLIYTYNPYTKLAPDSWTLENTYKGINDHPWSLFVRRHPKNGEICKNLDFDNTNDLGGYRIYCSGMNLTQYCSPDSNSTSSSCYDMSFEVLNQILSKRLSGVLYTKRHRDFPIKNSNKTDNDVLTEVESGFVDILLHARFRPTVTNFTTTYPHWHSGLSVLTQRSPEKSSLSKILSLVDRTSRFGFYLVLFITIFFFKWCLRQDVLRVVLDTILIICNMPLGKLPANVAPRIYLACLFMFVLTIKAVYQGNLSSLLTMSVPLPNVETIEDLVTFNYTIYGHKSYDFFFANTILEDRFIGVDDYNCSEYVLRDSSAACVRGERYLIPEMMRLGFHMPDNKIMGLYEVFVIREDWPIQQRVNLEISRMTETGLIFYWNSKQTDENRGKYNFFEELRKIKIFRVITLEELNFSFTILVVGLGGATVAFIMEVGMVTT